MSLLIEPRDEKWIGKEFIAINIFDSHSLQFDLERQRILNPIPEDKQRLPVKNIRAGATSVRADAIEYVCQIEKQGAKERNMAGIYYLLSVRLPYL